MVRYDVNRGIRRVIAAIAVMGTVMLSSPAMAQTAEPQRVDEIEIPLSDARKVAPISVRLSAIESNQKAQVIVIFGLKPERWQKIRLAIQQAVHDGYAVDGTIIGSSKEPPSLEIYADKWLVTHPINPNTVSLPVLTRLIQKIHREYYES